MTNEPRPNSGQEFVLLSIICRGRGCNKAIFLIDTAVAFSCWPCYPRFTYLIFFCARRECEGWIWSCGRSVFVFINNWCRSTLRDYCTLPVACAPPNGLLWKPAWHYSSGSEGLQSQTSYIYKPLLWLLASSYWSHRAWKVTRFKFTPPPPLLSSRVLCFHLSRLY